MAQTSSSAPTYLLGGGVQSRRRALHLPTYPNEGYTVAHVGPRASQATQYNTTSPVPFLAFKKSFLNRMTADLSAQIKKTLYNRFRSPRQR